MSHVSNKKKLTRKEVPCALTIGGSDSGGGAGIQADLKAFVALGVHGTTAITAVTAQNPDGVSAIEGVPAQLVKTQIEAAIQGFSLRAIKTGMLYNSEIIRAVATALEKANAPLVVDPVMISTSGAVLLQKSAIKELLVTLLPRAALLTPNLPEGEFLLKTKIRNPEEMRFAARALHANHGCAILMKGGHLKGASHAIDIFFDGDCELLLEARMMRGISTHGTGCTYSAAITGYLARGDKLKEAVVQAKEFITNAIANSWRCGRYDVLNSFWR